MGERSMERVGDGYGVVEFTCCTCICPTDCGPHK